MQVDYIKKLFEINIALSHEKNMYTLLEKIVLLAREFTGADAGTLYMQEQYKLYFKVVQTESLNIYIGGDDGNIDWTPVGLHNEDGTENFSNVSAVAALTGETIVIDDCYDEPNYDFSGTKIFDKKNNYRTKSMIVIPLKDFEGDVIGVLQLINKRHPESGKVISFGSFDRESAIALASQATVSILNAKLVYELERFLEIFMQSIGEAVDAKSPYTGNHVKKVGILTKKISEAMNDDKIQYKGMIYDKDRSRLLEIASWLHDVGKITVPDHIMDKATKLEGVVDRIEIIAERFEIVKRDLKIEYLEHKISKERYIEMIDDIEKDYLFLTEINSGDIFMTNEKLEKLELISKKSYLLDDKEVPLLRESDLQNLSIKKGTLTEEERKIIMSHANMTYKILENIPFPKKFIEAKHIASNHHEKLNGKGYPRGLTAEELSLDDRILAIADVFEALSSVDRPYKAPKTLSEIFKILSFMVKDGEIDGDIVRFIFDSKIYLEYAKEEMLPEQIDEPKLFF